jgi:hypothetical protein
VAAEALRDLFLWLALNAHLTGVPKQPDLILQNPTPSRMHLQQASERSIGHTPSRAVG